MNKFDKQTSGTKWELFIFHLQQHKNIPFISVQSAVHKKAAAHTEGPAWFVMCKYVCNYDWNTDLEGGQKKMSPH